MEKSDTLICQSCGMPLERNEDFGTNADDSKNKEYCRFCFKKGRFTDEGITMEQKIAKNIMIAKEMGIPEDQAKQMAENVIQKLKRWQHDWKDAWLTGIDVEITKPQDNRVFVNVRAEALHKTIDKLVNDQRFIRIATITGIDLGAEIEVIYHLPRKKLVLSIKTRVPKTNPTLPSIIDLLPSAALYEREIHDLFGLNFPGNPDLAPLILPDDWPVNVYPMRKEWTLTKLRNRLKDN